MKLSIRHRDDLRRIANEDGLSLDDALGRLLRKERQRRIGEQLSQGRSSDDQSVLDGGAHSIVELLERDVDAGR